MDNQQLEIKLPINQPNRVHVCTSEYLNESYKYQKHSSGLDVYVFPKKMNSTMAILGTRFGSVDNTFKCSKNGEFVTVPDGVAHFLEHKLFENEDGSDSFERFSQLGADANAFTSANRTAYYFECTKNFSKSLEELVRFVFNPYFTEKGIKKEIGIITEEINMYDDNPYDVCYYNMLEGLYESHSVKRNICGDEKSINEITTDILNECYDLFYTPSNTVLAVCGNTSLDVVMRVVDKILPESKQNKQVRKIIRQNENLTEPKEVHKKLVTQKMNVSKPIFSIGIKDTDLPRTKISSFKRDIMMALLGNILFSRSSEFDNMLIEKELIHEDLRYEYLLCETFAFASIYGKADDPEQVFEKVLDYVETVKATGLSLEDLKREKKVMITEHIGMFDSTSRIANALFAHGCVGTNLFDTCRIIESIRLSELEELLEKAFRKECFTMSVIYPSNGSEDNKEK